MSDYNSYESPFCTRYASREMQYVFSADKKFTTWRKLWVALARAEMKLGLPVTQKQVEELEAHIDDIDYKAAEEREKLVRHDVMSHVYAYGLACPEAKGIIHLGATSCYVGDNTDVIVMRDALQIVRRKLINVLAQLSGFSVKYKDMPCLAYTHLQPAQLTTVGKRATLWANELLMDLDELDYRISSLKLLGSKGTTGTQASFMELFDGDSEKVKELEKMIAEEMGFDAVVPVSGQTYSRKADAQILSTLGGIAQSAMKFANDMRILQNFKEMEEPFEKNQIGSSAMPYKRNPMRCERITALARYVMIDTLNPAFTAGTQWFERTLDDSANKRISVAEGFLAADAILNIMLNVTADLVVYPNVVRQRVMRELPFMASENIMMDAVKKGGDRQALHEKLRQYAMEAGKHVKEEGLENNLIELVLNDPDFGLNADELNAILKPENFTGRSSQQVEEFVRDCIKPILEDNKDILGETAELSV
ncbi:MAG: adenylosuccinate lyase [Oscillospiraceae bacterium]|jgi:adenylosuccinate lyase|nr:adenylosuccinate lyase [Oscillospiraceae bacterium]